MQTANTVKAFIIRYNEYLMNPSPENRVDPKYEYFQKADIDEFIKDYDQNEISRYPHKSCLTINDTIYVRKKGEPDVTYSVSMYDLYQNPNRKLHINHTKTLSPELKQKIAEARLKDTEDKLRESMAKEGCTLISKYESYKKPVHYIFEGLDYSVQPTRWNSGIRPHNVKCIRYTQEHIAQLFAKEGCQLISQYKNQKSLSKYKYKDTEYEVVWNDWKFYNSRPHLGRNMSHFTGS